MPHMTQAYPFEWRVLHFAQSLSRRLSGQPYASFLMLLEGTGAVRTVQFERPMSGWHDLIHHLDAVDTSYLFYDPFDAPEYTWVSWRRIGRATMERLLERPIEDADLVKMEPSTRRAPDLETPDEFPETWGVMF